MRWRGITKPGVFELGARRSTQEQSFSDELPWKIG